MIRGWPYFHKLDFKSCLLQIRVQVLNLVFCLQINVFFICTYLYGPKSTLKIFWGLAFDYLPFFMFRSCVKHQRTVIKSVTLIVMIIEAIVVLIRQQNHFRITRYGAIQYFILIGKQLRLRFYYLLVYLISYNYLILFLLGR